MARSDGLVHSKLPPDARITVRGSNAPIGTQDVETVAPEFIAAGMLALREALGDIARNAENRSNPVDEYNSAPITGAATESVVSVLPTYEYMPEKIESIIVSGPTGPVTLQLGDRQLAVTIPASGILVIAPVALILGRNDLRQLTAQTPGQYFIELMGVADRRFKI